MGFADFLILSANFGKKRTIAQPVPPSDLSAAVAVDDFFSQHDDESPLDDELFLERPANSLTR